MKIVISTPLYPPDIAEPAPYVKELARRLAGAHEVVVVAYGRLPEAVPGVRIIAVDKRRMLLVRLCAYFFALLRAARKADIIYAQNGPSVELPLGLVRLFCKTPLIVHIGDKPAHHYASQHFLRRTLERFAFGGAELLNDVPRERPEILPFAPRPEAELAAWERSWHVHLEGIHKLFSHA